MNVTDAIPILCNYWIERQEFRDTLMVASGITAYEVGELSDGWTIGEAVTMAIAWHNSIVKDHGTVEYPNGVVSC